MRVEEVVHEVHEPEMPPEALIEREDIERLEFTRAKWIMTREAEHGCFWGEALTESLEKAYPSHCEWHADYHPTSARIRVVDDD